MTAQINKYQACEEIDYDALTGDPVIDLLRRELAYFPDSCISKQVIMWYNATIVAFGDSVTITCATEKEPQTEESLTAALIELAVSENRRGGQRLLRRVFRQSQRALIQSTSRGT